MCSACNVLKVDLLRAEERRVALGVRLPVDDCAQAGLRLVALRIKRLPFLLDRLEDPNFDRNRLARFELNEHTRSVLEAFFHLRLAPGCETVPDGDPHHLGDVTITALNQTQRQWRAQQKLFELLKELAADVRYRSLEVIHLDECSRRHLPLARQTRFGKLGRLDIVHGQQTERGFARCHDLPV